MASVESRGDFTGAGMEDLTSSMVATREPGQGEVGGGDNPGL